jgi:hypothetical protein
MDVYAQLNVDFTFDEMRRCLVRGWGDLGGRTASCWMEFNRQFFDGRLNPLPMFFTPVGPYGGRIAWTCCAYPLTHIALCRPKSGNLKSTADRGVLLHEMIHQHLNERGDNPGHDGQPWRDEIMRLHFEITGNRIFAAAEKVIKVKQEDGRRKSHRVQKDGSKKQTDIARWPHSYGIELGRL